MAIVAVAVAALSASAGDEQSRSNAQAEQSRSLRDRVFGRNLPATGRYVSESGEAFILDRSGAQPLLRFERRPETWVLRPSPAPRGDIIYRTDSGDQVLRVTPDGGMTLYTTRAPGGSPVSMTGPAPALTLPSVSPAQLTAYSIQQSGRMSQALGHLVVVDIQLERPGLEGVVAETIAIVTEAVLRMSRSAGQRDMVARLRRVQIIENARSSINFADRTLTIQINTHQGPAGRPSSARIIRAVGEP